MLIGVGEIIDKTWDLYRGKFPVYLKLILWAVVPSTAVTIVQSIALSAFEDRPLLVIALSFLLSVAVFLISLYVLIPVVQSTIAFLHNEKPDPRKLLRDAVTLLVPFLVTTLATAIIVTAGFLLLVIPGVIFAIWFAFAALLTISERIRWRDALRGSRALVRGRWFPVLWRLAAPNIFWRLAVSVVVFGAIFVINGLSGSWTVDIAAAPAWRQALTLGVNVFIQGLALPLFVISTTVLLLDLKHETATERSALRQI